MPKGVSSKHEDPLRVTNDNEPSKALPWETRSPVQLNKKHAINVDNINLC